MGDEDIKKTGPGFIADLIKQGGTPAEGGMTNDDLASSGPSFVADLARQGGEVITDDED